MEETKCAVEEVGKAGVRGALRPVIATVSLTDQDEDSYFRQTCWHTSGNCEVTVHVNRPNAGLVQAYDSIYRKAKAAGHGLIIYLHDDVEVFEENWDTMITDQFHHDPTLAVLGFGGATGMGHPDIYKIPYEIGQLARTGYCSNQRGWEIHGGQEEWVRDVAVVDGFLMAVRTSFLDAVGGWGWVKSNFHCYDTAMCLMALRHEWKVRMLGLDCDHHGGGTSTKAEYVEWCREHGTTPEREHIEPHQWQYDEFRDVLPVRIK